jgi:hypothetical protein
MNALNYFALVLAVRRIRLAQTKKKYKKTYKKITKTGWRKNDYKTSSRLFARVVAKVQTFSTIPRVWPG